MKHIFIICLVTLSLFGKSVNAQNTQQVTAIQYYFNNDPGFGVLGNGAIQTFSGVNNYNQQLNILLPTLPQGFNNLFIRAKDENNRWSAAERRLFYVTNINLNYNLVAYQYYFDTDPGFVSLNGNGEIRTISPPTTSFNQVISNISIPNNLSSGFHQLYIRVKNEKGIWTIAERKIFYLDANKITQTITSLEYFFDTDPGVGNGKVYPIATSSNVNIVANVITPCLSNGNHFLFFRAKDNFGRWSIIEKDTITSTSGITAPTISANGVTSICNGSSVVLSTSDLSGMAYQWYNDLVPIANQTSSSISVTNPGVYTLQATCNGSPIVSNAISITVNTPSIWYRDNDNDTYGDVNTTSSSCIQPSGYVSNNTDCNDANVNIYPGATELCNSLDDDCNTIIDDINSPFTASINSSTAVICPGSNVLLTASPNSSGFSYLWSTGATTATINVSSAGTYSVHIINILTNCSSDASIVLSTGNPPSITVSNTGPYCSGATIQFNVSGTNINSYSWSGPNTYSSNSPSPSIANSSIANSGNYSVIITGMNGCTTTASTSVTVYALPTVSISSSLNTPYCEGSTRTLTAIAPTATSYLWSNNSTTSTYAISAAGNYTVTITDINSCSASTISSVIADPVLEIISNDGSIVCQGQSLTLNFDNASSLLWSTGQSNSTIVVSPTVNTMYTVQGTSTAGCIYKDTLRVTVAPTSLQAVSNLIPSDNSFNQNTSIEFSWAPSIGAATYDLYLWNSSLTKPSIPTISNTTNISETIGQLSYGTDYNWEVVAKNYCTTTAGSTQMFSTVQLPDLIVDSITAPTTAFSYANISVTWRVTNSGSGPTGGSNWSDGVYLSIDNVFNPADDPKIGSFSNLSFLNPGQSYLRTENVFVPVNFVGTYYLFVATDLLEYRFGNGLISNILESNEVNNTLGASHTISLSIPAAPDLIVTSVATPTAAFGLDSIAVTYTVNNRYPTTANGQWVDAVFVSSDSSFNISNATLLSVNPSPVTTLLSNASYTKTVKVQLPDSTFGTKWIHVVTDYSNAVFEATTENNNSGTITAPLQVTLFPPADLVTTSLVVPSNFSSGQSISVSYSVQNQGAHTPIVSYWVDKIYFSTLPAFNESSALLLKSVTYSSGLTLNPGNTYTRQSTVTIPNGISGTYYLYVLTDANNNVFEYTYTANNLKRSSPLNVSLTPYPDMVVSNFHLSPDTISSGGLLNITWSIANTGTGPTTKIWKDNVQYFSNTNTALGGTDFATFISNTAVLSSGNSFIRTAGMTAPIVATATKLYFKLSTDYYNDNYEYLYENNNGSLLDSIVVLPIPVPPCDLTIPNSSSPSIANSGQPISLSWSVLNSGSDSTNAKYWTDKVYLSVDQVIDQYDIRLSSVVHGGALQYNQGYTVNAIGTIPNGYSGNFYLLFQTDAGASVTNDQNSTNNTKSALLTIQLTPSPDLIVTALSAPIPLYAGQQVYLHYTVKNNGAAGIVQIPISDRAFISNSPSPGGVTQTLEATSKVRSLNTNQTYSDSVLVSIPIYLSGNKYLLLKTDNRDSVYEHNAEGNNFKALAVNIQPAPIYDLQISQLQLPSSLLLGQNIKIPYTITNTGTIPVSSTVKNAAYYSIDNQYSSGTDPVLGTGNSFLSLAPGISVIDTFDTKIKDINAGNYFGIARTNLLNTLPETNYSNNLLVTSTTTLVDAKALTLNISDLTQLNQSDLIYYKINVGANLDMIVTLISDNPSTFNEVYVAYNRTPSTTDYDFRQQSQNKANQRVLVPATQAGAYYIMIKTSTITFAQQNIEVKAITLPFTLLNISPNHLGKGIVTTYVDGAGFRPGMSVFLKNGTSVIAQGTITDFTSSMSVKVLWDLTNVQIGIYDLVLRNPNLAEVMLASGVEVEAATPYRIGAVDYFPEAIRSGTSALMTAVIENIGNTDIPVEYGEIRLYNFVDIKAVSKTGSGFLVTDLGDTSISTYNYNNKNILDPNIKKIPFLIRNMAPGQQFTIAFVANNFIYSSLPIMLSGKGQNTNEFIADYSKYLESYRQSYLRQIATAPPLQLQALVYNEPAFSNALFTNMISQGTLTMQELQSSTTPCASCGDYVLDPGSGPATAIYPNYTLGSQGYNWEINDPRGTAGENFGWDLLSVSNSVTISSTSVSPCIIHVRSLNSFDNSKDFLTTWEPGYNQRWPIVVAEGGISGFNSNKFSIDLTEFSVYNGLNGGTFSVTMSTVNNDTLYLNFIARIPNIGENGFDGGNGQPGKPGGRGGKGGPGSCQVSPGRGGHGGKGGIGLLENNTPNGIKLLAGEGGEGGEGGNAICTGGSGGEGGEGGAGGDFVNNSSTGSGGAGSSGSGSGGGAGGAGAGNGAGSGAGGGAGGQGGSGNGGGSGAGGSGGFGGSTGSGVAPPNVPIIEPDRTPPGCVATRPPSDVFINNCSGLLTNSYDAYVCKKLGVFSGCDPNEIVGPTGVDTLKWVSPYEKLSYIINFENDSTLASAAAQRVTIRQKLHANVNPFTVSIGNFGFSNHVFNVPPNSSSYSTRLELTDSLGVDVEVTAGLDIVNREVFWVFQSIDHNTGLAPYSPFIGLLPINNASGDGEGFVSYAIKANSSVNTGDSITAKAKIVFDINDPIETNTWINIIDAVAPQSTIDPLPTISLVDTIIINWSGLDDVDGLGLATYDIYMSDNNGPYTLLYSDQPDTFKIFHGLNGHAYSFYSLATDRVGNREAIKTVADINVSFGYPVKWYADADVDLYGNPLIDTLAVFHPNGYVADSTDCNDNDSLEHPLQIWYLDADADGYGNGNPIIQCLRPVNYKATSELIETVGDCNDSAPAIHHKTEERCFNNVDDNCNGLVDEGCTTAITLNLNLFIQGYYLGSGLMEPVLYNLFPFVNDTNDCDSIIVELHNQYNHTIVRSDVVLLHTNGVATIVYIPTLIYPASIFGDTYYIVIKHRNSIETWSYHPVLFTENPVTFDFTH